jgi:hypothetical protein
MKRLGTMECKGLKKDDMTTEMLVTQQKFRNGNVVK